MGRKLKPRACRGCGVEEIRTSGRAYCDNCRITCEVNEPHASYKCKGCLRLKAATYRESNPEYVAVNTRKSRARRYGLTLDQLEELESVERCAACGDAVGLVVDHDHETGRVRGMLCNPCNKALGFVRDDTSRLAALISYLGLYS